jgi:hypothetical protein
VFILHFHIELLPQAEAYLCDLCCRSYAQHFLQITGGDNASGEIDAVNV